MSELGHLSTPISLACRNIKRYRLDQSRQIHAAPKSDQPAQCELETLDAMSCLAPCAKGHIALVNVVHKHAVDRTEDTVSGMTREL
jgi:hypothetical protein